MSPDIAAQDFVWRNARVLDRHRFSFLFGDGPADAVIAALRPFQNGDGGFGNALEPDIRGSSSQPVPTEHALAIMDETHALDGEITAGILDWLVGASTEEGGVDFVLASVDEAPHAPWWVPTGRASINPTAGIAALLVKHGVDHPWIGRATEFCLASLTRDPRELGGDGVISLLTLLDHMADRQAADAAFAEVAPSSSSTWWRWIRRPRAMSSSRTSSRAGPTRWRRDCSSHR